MRIFGSKTADTNRAKTNNTAPTMIDQRIQAGPALVSIASVTLQPSQKVPPNRGLRAVDGQTGSWRPRDDCQFRKMLALLRVDHMAVGPGAKENAVVWLGAAELFHAARQCRF